MAVWSKGASALAVTINAWHCARHMERTDPNASADTSGCEASKKSIPSNRMIGFVLVGKIGVGVEVDVAD